jgi:hypothetical protein
MPLLLTRQNMSLHNFDDNHPWRWGTPGQESSVSQLNPASEI